MSTAPNPRRQAVAARWAVGAALVFMTGVGMVLLFLLTLATRNRALYEQNFGWLVAINVAVAGFLLLVIVWLGVRLALRFKRGKFGSRLLIKLAAIIGLVGVLPGLLIYTVSYQFVSRSIESWFDVRVESALSAGLNLGRTTLDTLAADLGSKTRVAAEGLGRSPNSSAVLALERLLANDGIRASFKRDAGIATTVKLRVVARQQQLIRLDFEDAPSHEILADKLDEYAAIVAEHDVVILSDYGKGGLTHVARMIELARAAGKPVLIDPKGDDYSKYAGATLLKPRALLSDGARQSPRGDREPPVTTLGPFGTAERLNWLVWKKRNRNFRSQCLMVARS